MPRHTKTLRSSCRWTKIHRAKGGERVRMDMFWGEIRGDGDRPGTWVCWVLLCDRCGVFLMWWNSAMEDKWNQIGQPTAYLDSLSRLIDLVAVLLSWEFEPAIPAHIKWIPGNPNPFILQPAGKCRGGNRRRRPLIYFWAAQQDNQGAEGDQKGIGDAGWEGQVASQGTNTHRSFLMGRWDSC